jgi:hypothetical protein
MAAVTDDEPILEEETHPLMTEEEITEMTVRKEEHEKALKDAETASKVHEEEEGEGEGDKEVEVDFDPLAGASGAEKDEAEDVDFDPLAPAKSSRAEKVGGKAESDVAMKLGAPTSPPKGMSEPESESESGNAVHDFTEIDDRMKEMDEKQKSYFVVRNPIDWAAKKTQILKEYTTLENISILGTVVDYAPSGPFPLLSPPISCAYHSSHIIPPISCAYHSQMV